jgi:inner membrane protein
VLAIALLPFAVTAVLIAWDRLLRRRMRPDAPEARARSLLWLSLLATLTHPALDWLNTYGVRLLMPFDGTWFYGDALFIIDPWLWLLTAAAVVLARTRGRLSAAAFLVLGCAATALVTLTGMVPVGAQLAWSLGIGAIVALRLSGRAQQRIPALAGACVVALVLYVGAMVAGSRAASAQADAWLRGRGIVPDELAAGPVPADPFVREVIARAGDTYYFVEHAWLREPALRFSHAPMPVGPRDPVVEAALGAQSLRGLANWLRFPSIAV